MTDKENEQLPIAITAAISPEDWKVYVERDMWTMEGLKLWIAAPDGTRLAIVQPTELVCRVVDRFSAEAQAMREASMRIPDGMARALLDALAAFYGGSSDVRQLQAQLKAERERCDRLIEHLAKSAPLSVTMPSGVKP